jgi:apolipoprotein D and lipocalin family protein
MTARDARRVFVAGALDVEGAGRIGQRGRLPRAPWLLMLAVWFLMGTSAPAVQAIPPVQTVPSVDLDRYLGDWFEIARFPNRFQDRCVSDVRASYARRDDGRIDVINRCRTADGESIEAKGVARIVDRTSSAKLEVRFAPAVLSFLPFVWGDYWIIGLADDYSWAVVGSPDRKYLWVLARETHMGNQLPSAALAAASRNGFDVARLVRTRHD